MLKNKLGPEGVFGLWSLLLNNTILTFLNVSGNHIQDEGLEHIGVGIQNNKTLKHLNISKNDITGKGLSSLIEVISDSGLKELIITLNPILDSGA